MFATLYKYFFRLLVVSAIISVVWLQTAFAAQQPVDVPSLQSRYVVSDGRVSCPHTLAASPDRESRLDTSLKQTQAIKDYRHDWSLNGPKGA